LVLAFILLKSSIGLRLDVVRRYVGHKESSEEGSLAMSALHDQNFTAEADLLEEAEAVPNESELSEVNTPDLVADESVNPVLSEENPLIADSLYPQLAEITTTTRDSSDEVTTNHLPLATPESVAVEPHTVKASFIAPAIPVAGPAPLTFYIPPAMNPARYKYLTTPPPYERDWRVTPEQAAISQGEWLSKTVRTMILDQALIVRWLWGAIGVVAFLIIAFLAIHIFFSTPSTNTSQVNDPSGNGSANSIVVAATATTVVSATTPVIENVVEAEKWGMVIIPQAPVLDIPVDGATVRQKLGQNTLLAFEKKSNAGWYMLAGGGWIKREAVQVFPNQAAAQAVLAQSNATATALAAQQPLTLATVDPNSQLSPADLSAKGMLTYPAVNCTIKAELQPQTGAKTYYLSNQTAYNSLKMLPVATHRWFCSEQDALTNGFVKSSSPILLNTPIPYNTPFNSLLVVTPTPLTNNVEANITKLN
jgi:hypothetical protein